ncbi:MAG: type II toxin-antitoxin system ParD family antitoxin [Hyphomonadaceae bacterium]|nr:type II toxin-antitoxin system ParD family antitoxin [Hyphomonadaceae bacterium]
MDVKIGSELEGVVSELVRSGRFSSAEEVIGQGVRLVAEQEQRFRELKALIDEAYAEDGVETPEDVIAAVEATLADPTRA